MKSWSIVIQLYWVSLLMAFTSSAQSTSGEFTSVVDILSESAEFSTFLRLLQRNGHIPYLNELQNFTLLAPVNSAFASEFEKKAEFDVKNYVLDDLVLQTSQISNGTTILRDSVKFPLSIHHYGNGEISINKAFIVEPDLTPNFQNATVHGISTLLPDPPKVGNLLEKLETDREGVHLFNSLIKSFKGFESLASNSTLLIPFDVNFYKDFNHIEINYLLDAFNHLSTVESSIARDWSRDRERFLQTLLCHKIIGGLEADDKSLINLAGQPIKFRSWNLGSCMSVNDSTPSVYSNMLYDRGIAHGFTEIPFLHSAVSFNTEKYLHGMNSTDFVRELFFRNLQHMIRDESITKKMTIFIPETALNEKFGFTKPSLLYHFIEDQIWLEDEFLSSNDEQPSTKMFQSAFCSSNKRLGGQCQRLKIQKLRGSYTINSKYKILHAKPYEIGKTLIYTISEDLQLPGDFLSALNPFYHCSRSLVFLRQSGLLKLPANTQGYTVLLPCFDSWGFFDLNFEYLQNNATAVNLIMKNLILDGLLYSDAKNVTVETRNILGEKVSLSVSSTDDGGDDETTFQLSTVDEVIRVNHSLDSFFDQGVIHPLQSAYFPRAVNITISDLLETTGATEFINFLEHFQDLSSIIKENKPYSILVPTASSLNMEPVGINSTNLQDFLKLHIVTGNYTKNLLHCEGQANTTLGEPLLCRESSPGSYLLRLENGADHEVRILRKGCSSFGNESCIFLIDRPISLLWLSQQKSHLHLPGIAVGVGVIVGVFSVVAIFFCLLVVFVGRSHTKVNNLTTSSPRQENTEDDSAPLLDSRNHTRPVPGSHRFAGAYSANASVPPMDVTTTSN